MEILVQYTTQLKAELRIDSEQIDVPDGSRFSDVLECLAGKYPTTFQQLVIGDDGRLLPSILPCVDDEQISPDDDPILKADIAVLDVQCLQGGLSGR